MSTNCAALARGAVNVLGQGCLSTPSSVNWVASLGINGLWSSWSLGNVVHQNIFIVNCVCPPLTIQISSGNISWTSLRVFLSMGWTHAGSDHIPQVPWCFVSATIWLTPQNLSAESNSGFFPTLGPIFLQIEVELGNGNKWSRVKCEELLGNPVGLAQPLFNASSC